MANKKPKVKSKTIATPITVKETRLSLIQFLPVMALLKSRQPPPVPFPFLLSAADFQNKFAQALISGPVWRSPWREDTYGRLFWSRYLGKESARESRTTDEAEAWRLLVPFNYDVQQGSALSLNNCGIEARAYLYPWGMGLLLDATCTDPMPLFDAVDHAFKVKRKGTGMLQSILKTLRSTLYSSAADEDPSDIFSVFTVIDAAGVPADTEVVPTGPIHRALEALAGWNPQWKTMKLEDLSRGTIDIRQSPAGHILYGRERGRAVCFPGQFRPTSGYQYTLSCYHQNLTIASLHAESLCQIAHDAASEWNKRSSLTPFSATYAECARLAAGILGRLHGRKEGSAGRKPDRIYRSGSVRTQILVYKDDVNTVRTKLLIPPSPLDA